LLLFTALAKSKLADATLDYLYIYDSIGFGFYRNPNQSFEYNREITAIVIVIHGNARNAVDYYGYMQDSLDKYMIDHNNQSALSNVFVLAPWFPLKNDLENITLPVDLLFWDTSASWKEGGESTHLYPVQYSSFTCLDKLLNASVELFPNLRTIQVAGHSAGGQTVVRYALANRFEPKLIYTPIEMYYTVANPSGFPYLDEKRPVFKPTSCDNYCVNTTILASEYEFDVPPSSAILECPKYNHWKFGLNGTLPSYIKHGLSIAEMKNQFFGRKVHYLNGEADVCNSKLACTHCKDTDMEKQCEAELQGLCRLERGFAWFQYIKYLNSTANHSFSSVPGIGHDPVGVFNSKEGQQALFSQILTFIKPKQ